MTIIADGTHIEVWRGPKGGTQTRLCSVDNAAILSGTRCYLFTYINGAYAFDDIQLSAEDRSTTTYAYDTANQLTSMTVNGVATNYTYDAWGRNIGKTEGAKSATYYYSYGDKLYCSLSNFPGEHGLTVNEYDGLGRRRKQGLLGSGTTWFRWLGMEESGEYASAGGWAVGALQTGYVPGLASFAGADPTRRNGATN